jgi:aryl-alcohol dehydrogenase-like predicted oxidoreductase
MSTDLSSLVAGLLKPGLPRLGFGSGEIFAGATRGRSVGLVQAAFDAGFRYFDTARLYGNGEAEVILGSVLPRVREQVAIASKVGILPWSMLTWRQFKHRAAKAARLGGPLARAIVPAPPPSAARFGAFARKDMVRSVERSLRALRTDYLDILLLHECSVADAQSTEVMDFLHELRARGRIRAFGTATHFAETCQIVQQNPQVAQVLQIPSDALNGNIAALPANAAELLITHSALKQSLPRLLAHLAADPVAGQRWTSGTGLAPDDRVAIARLLLADAIAANPKGIVVFSTSRAERFAEAIANRAEARSLQALREEFGRLTSSGA